MRSQLWMDSENGGLDPKIHSPLEFAFLAVKNGKIVDRLELSLRIPPLVVTQEALAVNKINVGEFQKHQYVDRKLAVAKYRDFMSKNFYTKFLGGRAVYDKPCKENMPAFCGHNTVYDRPFLQAFLESDYDMCYYHRIDTMMVVSALREAGKLPGLENAKLETVCEYFCRPKPTMFHNAMCDVTETYELWKILLRVMNGEAIDSIRRSVEAQPTLFDESPNN
jgi:DNA polymerase III alpha subunit (gram-positive type)